MVALHGADHPSTRRHQSSRCRGFDRVCAAAAKGYLKRLREISDERTASILIFDAVIHPASAASGAVRGADYFGVTPDLMTTAKGHHHRHRSLRRGVQPAARFHDALMNGPEGMIELFHGYTYSAHRSSCAAGLATLDIYKGRGAAHAWSVTGEYWRDALHSLKWPAET